jgi:hypothetical protein
MLKEEHRKGTDRSAAAIPKVIRFGSRLSGSELEDAGEQISKGFKR